jgi:hypothetical protein
MTPYVHRFNREDRLWQVGFYSPAEDWFVLNEFETSAEAAAYINYLNGGEGKEFSNPVE